jgi:1-acyl-sn-glycerol-3-phosphate acyltransferase
MAVGQPLHGLAVERQVLALVGALSAELTGGQARTPALDATLDRDLGISSLERVELLLRIERAFGVRLADSVMAEAATPRDLAAAVAQASSVAATLTRTPIVLPATPGLPAPATARTLVDVLHWHADRTPDRPHIYLREDGGHDTPITYGALLAGASRVAAGLERLRVGRGETVALMLRTETAFFEALFGTLLAGAVPVPLYPPFRRDELLAYAERQRGILAAAGARVLVTFREAARVAELVRAQVPALEAIVTVDELQAGDAAAARVDALAGSDDPALIQFTSGSTSAPKGVLLSHANLLANIRAIGEGIAVTPDDVCVSWLPLYHDMGLIGAWFAPLYFGVPVAIMSPLAFLSRPARWLWALHEHHGTVSPAPNFAYDLCVRKIADEELEGLDLSRWRLALNGSEAVSPDTLARFTGRFAKYGFRPEAMCPVYGLAECAVGLAISPSNRAPRVDRIAREPFERAREVRPSAPDDPRPLRFVSCGRPLPRHEVRIVDAGDRIVGERVDGHVQFRGPSVTSGYYRNPEATRAAVHDGWMDSGDLGYLADGELFITGREKDLIIQAGRNLSAAEVEEIVSAVDGVRKGRVAAFAVRDETAGTERLVVVAESNSHVPAARTALRDAIRDRIVTGIGVPPGDIVIAPPGSVLKTSSGKIRRAATRDAYLQGRLGRQGSMARQFVTLLASAGWLRIRHYAGQAGRALLTAYIAAVFAVTVPVLWAYLLAVPAGQRADRAARRWSRLILRLCGYELRVHGRTHLEGLPSAVLVANHASYIDPIVLMAAIPVRFQFVAKRRLLRYPVIGTVIQKAGHATIDKADVSQRLAGAADISALLTDRRLLVIFPEGTFVRAPGLLPFRLGAFKAAVDRGCPVVPVAIRGARDVLPADTWLFRRAPLHVTIGPPMAPQATDWPEMVRLRDAARDEIARHSH